MLSVSVYFLRCMAVLPSCTKIEKRTKKKVQRVDYAILFGYDKHFRDRDFLVKVSAAHVFFISQTLVGQCKSNRQKSTNSYSNNAMHQCNRHIISDVVRQEHVFRLKWKQNAQEKNSTKFNNIFNNS